MFFRLSHGMRFNHVDARAAIYRYTGVHGRSEEQLARWVREAAGIGAADAARAGAGGARREPVAAAR